MTSVAKFIVKDNEPLRDITLITLIDTGEIRAIRLDALAALVLCEFALQMKFGIFISNKWIENLCSSDSTIFLQQMLEENRNLMNLVILAITAQSEYY